MICFFKNILCYTLSFLNNVMNILMFQVLVDNDFFLMYFIMKFLRNINAEMYLIFVIVSAVYCFKQHYKKGCSTGIRFKSHCYLSPNKSIFVLNNPTLAYCFGLSLFA